MGVRVAAAIAGVVCVVVGACTSERSDPTHASSVDDVAVPASVSAHSASDDTSASRESATTTAPAPPVHIAIQASASPGGFAEEAGLTGGHGKPEYVISSADDSGPGTYRDMLSGGDRYIRFDPGLDGSTIVLASPVRVDGSNITVDGSGVDVTITREATRFTGTNIVVAGLRFSDMDASGNVDAVTIRDASGTQVFGLFGNVFETASDGLVDVIWNGGHDVHGTICGNRFAHHDKAMLIGTNTESREGGTYHVTLCRNHWLDVYQRAPLSRGALVHQYNSVFERYGKPDGAGGGSKAGRASEHLLEHNVAIPRAVDEETWSGEVVSAPRDEFAGPQQGDLGGGRVRDDGSLVETTDDLTATVVELDAADVFTPPYDYDLVPASPAVSDAIVETAGTCAPSETNDVMPCAPLLLLGPGEPIRAIVDGEVDSVKLVTDDGLVVTVDGTGRGNEWEFDVGGLGVGLHVVRAAADTAAGVITSPPVQVVVLGA